jgi:hypothetical protein
MDEILIEEKKYVSSKRAAKMTGYAKDYVGQLCREGRVQARLVGRSWYVLEAAIQDHKFGTAKTEPKKASKKETVLSSTWEQPRYEAAAEEFLPPLSRIENEEPPVHRPDSEQELSQRIQESWKTWFDRFDTVKDPNAPEDAVGTEALEAVEVVELVTPEDAQEEIEINIPIHTVSRALYQPSIEEAASDTAAEFSQKSTTRKGIHKGIARVVQMIGILLAIVTATTAVLGSGYVDEYVVSLNQARIIAGVGLYNK